MIDMGELRDIEYAWQKGIYVRYEDRKQVFDLAAVGALVHHLSKSDLAIAPELRRLIEVAQTNRKSFS